MKKNTLSFLCLEDSSPQPDIYCQQQQQQKKQRQNIKHDKYKEIKNNKYKVKQNKKKLIFKQQHDYQLNDMENNIVSDVELSQPIRIKRQYKRKNISINNYQKNHYQDNSSIGTDQEDQDDNKKRRKRRARVTLDTLAKIKKLFPIYQLHNENTRKYKKGIRVTFKTIGDQLDLSIAEVRNLYKEFQMDEKFTQRQALLQSGFTRMRQGMRQIVSQHAANITSDKMDEQQLIKQNKQFAKKMKQKTTKVEVKPLIKQRRICRTLKKLGQYQQNLSSQQEFQSRYIYCNKYIEVLQSSQYQIYCLEEVKLTYNGKDDNNYPTQTNFTMLVVMDESGLISYQFNQKLSGSTQLLQILDGVLPNVFITAKRKKKILLMGCQCSQISTKLLALLESKHKFYAVRVPTGVPMFNPLYQLMDDIIVKVPRNGQETIEEVLETLEEIVQPYKNWPMKSYFEQVQRLVQLALERKYY